MRRAVRGRSSPSTHRLESRAAVSPQFPKTTLSSHSPLPLNSHGEQLGPDIVCTTISLPHSPGEEEHDGEGEDAVVVVPGVRVAHRHLPALVEAEEASGAGEVAPTPAPEFSRGSTSVKIMPENLPLQFSFLRRPGSRKESSAPSQLNR